VVSAVKAESVVAKVAAVNPSKKMTDGISVKMKGDFRKKQIGSWFPVTKSVGTSIPFFAA
jgi:hypothetical protein